MDRRLEKELQEIETACAGIESALGAEDWQAAEQGNADLQARFDRITALLGDSGTAAADSPLALVAARLESVLAQHAGLAERLVAWHDEAGAELKKLREGRRGAKHYLDTAES